MHDDLDFWVRLEDGWQGAHMVDVPVRHCTGVKEAIC